jgi:hypothetical protein
MKRKEKIEEAISKCESFEVLRVLNLAWWKEYFKQEKENTNERKSECQHKAK